MAGRSTYLRGDLWAISDLKETLSWLQKQDDSFSNYKGWATEAIAAWKEVMDHQFQVGGEQGYGWGRIKLEKIDNRNSLLTEEWSWDSDNNGEVVLSSTAESSNILAHTLISTGEDGLPPDMVEGQIEPLLGRETSGKGFGASISSPLICWKPGSMIRKKDPRLVVGQYGVWQSCPEISSAPRTLA